MIYILSLHGPMRFGALQRAIPGISTKVLTERLRMLERAALIDREQSPTIPPAVTYSMTDRGAELHQVMKDISHLALRWNQEGWTPEGEKTAAE